MPSPLPFQIFLDSASKTPIYQQLAAKIHDAVLNGQLKPGSQLPATRALADDLGISRFTVVKSYRLLTAQGFIESTQGSGAKVSGNIATGESSPTISDLNSLAMAERGCFALKLSTYARRIESVTPIQDHNPYFTSALNYGGPPVELLPLNQWRRKMSHHIKVLNSDAYQFWSDPQGYPPLREAIAKYVARARSVRTTADQVAVFSGYQPALECISRLLLDPGDSVVVENPGYVGASRVFQYQGAQIIPMSVDEDGLQVSKLKELKEVPAFILTTPSFQEPTGVALSHSRRLELLNYARERNVFIIEDDYDSEFRFGRKPVPALQSLDNSEKVI